MITIAIGTDHRGFLHKEYIIQQITREHDNVHWSDEGAYTDERSDYPLFARKVCCALREQRVTLGVLLCGSGVGMSIAANRFSGIYAALAWNEEIARVSRAHDCANVLVLPADYISASQAVDMIRAWLSQTPLIDRHSERLQMIDRISTSD